MKWAGWKLDEEQNLCSISAQSVLILKELE
jgi:hypothetical protein